jgi:hypothetical protein
MNSERLSNATAICLASSDALLGGALGIARVLLSGGAGLFQSMKGRRERS